jgi:integrase
MRYRKPFSIYPRIVKGKTVYYYRTYDENGKIIRRSTGQTAKTQAEAYVVKLIQKGELIPKGEITFNDFSKGFWDEGSLYVRRQKARGKELSPLYLETSRIYLEKHISPYFGKKLLSKITPQDIEKWIIHLKDALKLSDSTVRNCYATLRIMINEAERLDLIYRNPFKRTIRPMVRQPEKGILTIDEYRVLFDERNIESIWGGELLHYTANLLSATGGLRLGEVLGLQNKDIHDGFIHVAHSWNKYGLKSTKSGHDRYIPLPAKTIQYLSLIKNHDPEAFTFSPNNGIRPVSKHAIIEHFKKALAGLGISEQERKERRLSFHSHRHFYTTLLRKHISDSRLQALTGHRSLQMLQVYDHPRFNLDEYKDVVELQDSLLSP